MSMSSILKNLDVIRTKSTQPDVVQLEVSSRATVKPARALTPFEEAYNKFTKMKQAADNRKAFLESELKRIEREIKENNAIIRSATFALETCNHQVEAQADADFSTIVGNFTDLERMSESELLEGIDNVSPARKAV